MDRKRAHVTREDLDRIDKALTVVGGHFLAAAKLLDLTPKEFRNRIGRHDWLKVKWGLGKRGRPEVPLPFRITPYEHPKPTPAELVLPTGGPGLVFAIRKGILDLPQDDRLEMLQWLQGELGGGRAGGGLVLSDNQSDKVLPPESCV